MKINYRGQEIGLERCSNRSHQRCYGEKVYFVIWQPENHRSTDGHFATVMQATAYIDYVNPRNREKK